MTSSPPPLKMEEGDFISLFRSMTTDYIPRAFLISGVMSVLSVALT